MKDSARQDKTISTLTISTVLIDDEQLAREELAYLLKAHPEVEIVGQGHNGLEAVNLIREHAPDLLFLDVQMPGLDGFGVLKKLIDRKIALPHIIFATAYDHYAVKAFEVNAVDYLLKPIEKTRLEKALQRVKQRMGAQAPGAERLEALLQNVQLKQPQNTKLLVKNQNRLFLVDASSVIYANIQDGLISIVAQNMEGTSNYRTVEELQTALDPATFWRAHRSYLVNINKIKEVVPWFKSSYMLRMDDRKQTEVPVSRAQTKRLRELFKL